MSSGSSEACKRKRETLDSVEAKEEKPNVNEEAVVSEPKNDCVTAPFPKRTKGPESDSDSDCISQEDLLAQLGLNSVKKLQTVEPDPNKVIHPDPPKDSILKFLKMTSSLKIGMSLAMPPEEKPLNNESFEEYDLDDENIESKEKLILRLQNNLRNEEAKLMLLRKLYVCQNERLLKDANISHQKTATVSTSATSQANTTNAQRKTIPLTANSKQPPPKPPKHVPKLPQKSQHKSQQPVLLQKPPQPNVTHSSTVQPRVVFLSQPRGAQPVIIAPKLVPVPGKPSHDHGHHDNRSLQVPHSSNTTANSNMSCKSLHRQHAGPPSVGYSHSAHLTKKHSAQGGTPVVGDKNRPAENGLLKMSSRDTLRTPSAPEQSHAEAKMALRKQLEKTLLEIPLPKPPVPDWNFVPSVVTQNFTILIGLEGVVNHILESQADNLRVDGGKTLIAPKFCCQCDTDFTPCWRARAGDGRSDAATLCESCYTQKIKKTLKSEHTTRLKDAFVKALKQEQEVEKKYQLSGATVSSVGKTDVAGKSQGSRASSTHSIIQPQARLVYHPVHSIQPQVYQPHHSIVHQLQQQQLQQQHHELEGSHRPDSRYFTYIGQSQPKQRHNYTTDSDRQREYLLDMIPSGHASRGYRI